MVVIRPLSAALQRPSTFHSKPSGRSESLQGQEGSRISYADYVPMGPRPSAPRRTSHNAAATAISPPTYESYSALASSMLATPTPKSVPVFQRLVRPTSASMARKAVTDSTREAKVARVTRKDHKRPHSAMTRSTDPLLHADEGRALIAEVFALCDELGASAEYVAALQRNLQVQDIFDVQSLRNTRDSLLAHRAATLLVLRRINARERVLACMETFLHAATGAAPQQVSPTTAGIASVAPTDGGPQPTENDLTLREVGSDAILQSLGQCTASVEDALLHWSHSAHTLWPADPPLLQTSVAPAANALASHRRPFSWRSYGDYQEKMLNDTATLSAAREAWTEKARALNRQLQHEENLLKEKTAQRETEKQQRRDETAATNIQRIYRGHKIRMWYLYARMKRRAATKIQRFFRRQWRKKGRLIEGRLYQLVAKVQALWRGAVARRQALLLRRRWSAAHRIIVFWRARRVLQLKRTVRAALINRRFRAAVEIFRFLRTHLYLRRHNAYRHRRRTTVLLQLSLRCRQSCLAVSAQQEKVLRVALEEQTLRILSDQAASLAAQDSSTLEFQVAGTFSAQPSGVVASWGHSFSAIAANDNSGERTKSFREPSPVDPPASFLRRPPIPEPFHPDGDGIPSPPAARRHLVAQPSQGAWLPYPAWGRRIVKELAARQFAPAAGCIEVPVAEANAKVFFDDDDLRPPYQAGNSFWAGDLDAAITIQCCWRCYVARKRAAAARETRNQRLEETAVHARRKALAFVFQRFARARLAICIKLQREGRVVSASCQVQRWWRRILQQRRNENLQQSMRLASEAVSSSNQTKRSPLLAQQQNGKKQLVLGTTSTSSSSSAASLPSRRLGVPPQQYYDAFSSIAAPEASRPRIPPIPTKLVAVREVPIRQSAVDATTASKQKLAEANTAPQQRIPNVGSGPLSLPTLRTPCHRKVSEQELFSVYRPLSKGAVRQRRKEKVAALKISRWVGVRFRCRRAAAIRLQHWWRQMRCHRAYIAGTELRLWNRECAVQQRRARREELLKRELLGAVLTVQYALGHRRLRVALCHLEELDREIQRRRRDNWRSALIIQRAWRCALARTEFRRRRRHFLDTLAAKETSEFKYDAVVTIQQGMRFICSAEAAQHRRNLWELKKMNRAARVIQRALRKWATYCQLLECRVESTSMYHALRLARIRAELRRERAKFTNVPRNSRIPSQASQ